jgi:fructose-1,6-bisphosphatase I
MAYIMEQAGGQATDGREDILSLKVESFGQRSPIYIGSKTEVQMAQQFLS